MYQLEKLRTTTLTEKVSRLGKEINEAQLALGQLEVCSSCLTREMCKLRLDNEHLKVINHDLQRKVDEYEVCTQRMMGIAGYELEDAQV